MANVQSGIKSKERVQKHGEVFTPDSIVNDMLDLTEKGFDTSDYNKFIDRTYLEPSCGNGNFLLRILDRKLAAVQQLPVDEQKLGIVRAFASVYGVDIQSDNVDESKERMMTLLENGVVEVLELPNTPIRAWKFKKFDTSLIESVKPHVKYILDRNIQHGNTLNGKGGKGCDTDNCATDLIITEYVWDGETVTMNEIPFNELKTDLIIGSETKHYTELGAEAKGKRAGRRRNTQVVEDYDF